MEFNSQELKQATWVAPNSTHIINEKNDYNLNDKIRSFVILKDATLLKSFELAQMKSCKTSSGLFELIFILRILKEEFLSNHREDNIKNLTIRKNFDSIISNLECLNINNIDISSDILNTIIIAFLSKNFLTNESKPIDNF